MKAKRSWKPFVNECNRTFLVVIVLLVVASIPSVVPEALADSNGQHASSGSATGRAAVQRISGGGRTAGVINRSSSSAVAVTAVRNLEAEAWLERLEIEVKNITTKPVYCLVVLIVFPDLKRTGPDGAADSDVAILLSYGRLDLLRDGNLATASDIPVKPGESHVLRIPESHRRRLENDLADGTVPESAVKRFAIMVDTVLFGDGTGFKSGLPFPAKQQSSLQGGKAPAASLGLGPPPTLASKPLYWSTGATHGPLSASNPRVREVSLVRPMQYSCGPPLSNCWKYSDPIDDVCAAGCTMRTFSPSSNGTCGFVQYVSLECNGYYSCSYDMFWSCSEYQSCGQCSDVLSCQYCTTCWISGTCSCAEDDFEVCPTGCNWDYCQHRCVGSGCESPILVDVSGNGFDLTDAKGGVEFDIDGDGNRQRLGWTSANSDDAFLALDRNRNGVIDDGTELFGNFTSQAQSSNRNGFIALAEFDMQANGGNGDGRIDSADAIFGSLRLWQDLNHNGLSEGTEIFTLPSLGLAALDLNYKELRRADRYGNVFRYRAKVLGVNGTQTGRWAYDVFLVGPR